MAKVALMVGHGKTTSGTWDSGCAYAGYTEAALMLPITKAAVKYLRQSGVTVISDADTNNNRNMVVDVEWANREKVDAYISVHCDWYKAPTGVYPLYVSARGKKIADALNSAIKTGIPMKSRGVCKRTDLYELNATNAPACILETGSIKADIKILKNSDKYGKVIAKGICNYLGVPFKETETKAPAAKAPEVTLYRVRKTWADAKSQAGAYKVLANAKRVADEKGLTVFDNNGKAVYVGQKKTTPKTDTMQDAIAKACKEQTEWAYKSKYNWQSSPTVAKSKTNGTCVTYVACVFQRIKVFPSGKYIWHNGSGFGTGKAYGQTDKFNITYYNNKKTLKDILGTLQKGDVLMYDDNKSGKSGAGGHIEIYTGEGYKFFSGGLGSGHNTSNNRVEKATRKVLAVARLKKK